MKDHYKLNSKGNVIRQALLDFSQNDETTIKGLLDYQLEKGTKINRLVDFAHRRLKINKESALVGILILTDRLL